mmetsp:Transcript_13804/g.41715  ORF Transcript_13804/g.41715 Transcript_13804/m.41715 type:complete len:241 (+) Transcript_13804:244-966(+)
MESGPPPTMRSGMGSTRPRRHRPRPSAPGPRQRALVRQGRVRLPLVAPVGTNEGQSRRARTRMASSAGARTSGPCATAPTTCRACTAARCRRRARRRQRREATWSRGPLTWRGCLGRCACGRAETAVVPPNACLTCSLMTTCSRWCLRQCRTSTRELSCRACVTGGGACAPRPRPGVPWWRRCAWTSPTSGQPARAASPSSLHSTRPCCAAASCAASTRVWRTWWRPRPVSWQPSPPKTG